MESKYFVGIDISSDYFTASFYSKEDKKSHTFSDFANSEKGFLSLLKELSLASVNVEESIYCMEATGVYGEHLAHFLYKKGYFVCVENPLKVKRSFGISNKKSDAIDSKRIAEYAYRFMDELRNWKPKPQIVEEIRMFLTQREQIIKQKVANINSKKALERKYQQSPEAIKNIKDMIVIQVKLIKNIEKIIIDLIKANPEYMQTYSNIISIPGIGNIIGAHILVMTNGFSEHLNYKELASYLGIVPEIYESGTSVRRRSSSSGLGPGTLRKLLYLASMTSRLHNKSMKEYFLRKVANGKSKKLVLNNIGNKLLKLIVALIKSGNSYNENFRSINSVF